MIEMALPTQYTHPLNPEANFGYGEYLFSADFVNPLQIHTGQQLSVYAEGMPVVGPLDGRIGWSNEFTIEESILIFNEGGRGVIGYQDYPARGRR